MVVTADIAFPNGRSYVLFYQAVPRGPFGYNSGMRKVVLCLGISIDGYIALIENKSYSKGLISLTYARAWKATKKKR